MLHECPNKEAIGIDSKRPQSKQSTHPLNESLYSTPLDRERIPPGLAITIVMRLDAKASISKEYE
jgi:hypothetical protein